MPLPYWLPSIMDREKFFHKYPFKMKTAHFIPVEHRYYKDGGGYCINGLLHTAQEDIYGHLLLVGATGSGKSSKILIPSLLNIDHSMIVHDPHGELHTITHKYLRLKDFDVQILSFSEVYASFNPLQHIDPEKDIHFLSHLIVTAGKEIDLKEAHWSERATELIATIMHFVYQTIEEPTLLNILDILMDAKINPKELEKQFIKNKIDNFYLKKFLAFTIDKTSELSGIFSTAIRALNSFGIPSIANVISNNTLYPKKLRERKTAIFIQTDPTRKDLYKKPISLFIELLWLNTQHHVTDEDLSISFLIDEADSLYLPTLPSLLTQVRKFRISLLVAIQSHGQLKSTYKDYQTIIENTKTHIYLGSQNHETATRLEQALGKIEGSDEHLAPREKLRMLDHDEALILAHGEAPMFTTTIPYFQNQELLALLKHD